MACTYSGEEVDLDTRHTKQSAVARLCPAPREMGIVLLVVFNLTYGVLQASSYGQSWDDPGDAAYGEATVQAYAGSQGYQQMRDRVFYGPLYLMLSSVATRFAHVLAPTWSAVDVRHLLNDLAFQVAIVAFYFLARRLLAAGPAFVATLLFACQPVLFGHAFINQKDIPFLAAFSWAVLLGLRLAESREGGPEGASSGGRQPWPASGVATFVRGWKTVSLFGRVLFLLLVVVGAAVVADLWLGQGIFGWARALLARAYTGTAPDPLNWLFARVASDAYKTSLASYFAKLRAAFGWVRLVGSYLALLPALLGAKWIYTRAGGTGSAFGRTLRDVLPGGLTLGAAIAIRVAGAFAGILVTATVLMRKPRRSLATLIVYWGVALSVTYLAWPFLWEAPFARLLETARIMAQFPAHLVIFRGATMTSATLPWEYLPVLLSIQLTEPVLLLVVAGLASLVLARRAISGNGWIWAALAVWFLAPLLGSVVFRIGLYSNFRQLLFSLPPLFVLSGQGLALLWPRVSKAVKIGLAMAVVAPGVAGIVQLRPYEYSFYNSLAGGVKRTVGQFPHDYWCTSYREAMAYVNENASEGARVAIAEPFEVAATFAREDLQLVRSRNDPEAAFQLRCNNQEDFTVQNLRDFPVVYVVSRGDSVLGVVFRGKREIGSTTPTVGGLASDGDGTDRPGPIQDRIQPPD